MKKIMDAKAAGCTLEQCMNMMAFVAQWRYAGREIYNHGIYYRSRPWHSTPKDGGECGHVDIYYFDATTKAVETLCYNTTAHRAKVLLRALATGDINKIDPAVIENYKTNGYSTRRGIYADYGKGKVTISKLKDIARSHADYMGNETGNATVDHNNRVQMRR